jgi:hypothetical protein
LPVYQYSQSLSGGDKSPLRLRMSMNFAEGFQSDKYLYISRFLSLEIVRLAMDYTLLRKAFFTQPEKKSEQVPGTHSAYADTLMEVLLLHCQPKIEALTGLKLFPTYSYYRVYKPGDELEKHQDRRACEISVTVCLGYDYVTDDPEYHWDLYVGGVAFEMEPGDAVIYRGCDVEHWRTRFEVQEDSWHSQLFLHYVDAAQEDAKEYLYDNRPYAGAPLTLRKQGA